MIVEGFVFTSGPTPQTATGGQGVLAVRVNDLIIRRNRFEAGFTESIDLALYGDVAWQNVWFDHPADRGNTLTVDGQSIANGVQQFYSAAGCPGL